MSGTISRELAQISLDGAALGQDMWVEEASRCQRLRAGERALHCQCWVTCMQNLRCKEKEKQCKIRSIKQIYVLWLSLLFICGLRAVHNSTAEGGIKPQQ